MSNGVVGIVCAAVWCVYVHWRCERGVLACGSSPPFSSELHHGPAKRGSSATLQCRAGFDVCSLALVAIEPLRLLQGCCRLGPHCQTYRSSYVQYSTVQYSTASPVRTLPYIHDIFIILLPNGFGCRPGKKGWHLTLDREDSRSTSSRLAYVKLPSIRLLFALLFSHPITKCQPSIP